MSTLSTFSAFTAARLGIYASMKGLQVTGNNISNINTQGYTRQVLDQISMRTGGNDRYQSMYDVNVGSGALCVGVSQIRDPYLDIRFRNEQAGVGALDTKMSGLEDLKALFDEVGKGKDDGGVMEAQLSDLISQLQKLSKPGNGQVSDTLVRSSAEAIAKLLNTYSGNLDTITKDTVKGFQQDISTVNGLLSNIRDLNAQIRTSEIHGDSALELRDQRNNLIDELSYYVKIDVTTEQENMGGGQFIDRLVIKMAGSGQNNGSEKSTLVYGEYATQLSIEQVPERNPNYDPNDPGHMGEWEFLKPDGTSTNNRDEANRVDSYNYDMLLDALKDGKNRVLSHSKQETVQNPDWPPKTVTGEPDTGDTRELYKLAVEVYNRTLGNTATGPNGEVVTLSYQLKEIAKDVKLPDGTMSTETTFSIVADTTTASGGVALKDNDLYGSLQARRELLTEAGEFTSKSVIEGPPVIDAKAGAKRGIPYYQHTLDAMAQKFAAIFNDANTIVHEVKQPIMNYTPRMDETGTYFLATAGCALQGDALKVHRNPVTLEIELTEQQASHLKPLSQGGLGHGVYDVANEPKTVDGTESFDLVPGCTLTDPVVHKDGTGKIVLTEQQKAEMLPPPDGLGYGQFTINPGDTTQMVEVKEEHVLLSTGSDNNTSKGITAKNISISKGWTSGETRIIRSKDPDAVSEDNENILHLIAQLSSNEQEYRASDVVADAYGGDTVYFSGTLHGLFSNTATTLGDETRVTGILLDTYYAAATEINGNRDSVMGVDLNDEAANLMMYQKTYAAACRVMTTIDEVLDKLINGTGVVGR